MPDHDVDVPPTEPDPAADGSPQPDPGLPPPAEVATPVPAAEPGDESARQAAATVRSVSRLEESN